MAFEFTNENAKALLKLKEHGVVLSSFPDDVTQAAKKALDEVLADFSQKSPDFKRVWDSAHSFLNQSIALSRVSTGGYLKIRDQL